MIERKALKKYLPKNIYKNITNGNFNQLGLSNIIDCVSVGGMKLEMPIIDIKSAKVYDDVNVKSFDCVLGIASRDFNDKSYSCLLHRDFV